MAWKNLSLRSKLLTIGITLSVIPLLLIALLNYSQSNQLKDVAQKESMKLAETDLENIAKSVYTLCDISKNTLEHSVVSHFNVAQDIFTRKGEVTFSQDKITWDAKNQFTLASQRIEVPKMLVGGEWLGQTTEFHKEVPLVDTVLNLTSSHCTVFQRINEAGDMLRIATTVAGKDGNRAIGT